MYANADSMEAELVQNNRYLFSKNLTVGTSRQNRDLRPGLGAGPQAGVQEDTRLKKPLRRTVKAGPLRRPTVKANPLRTPTPQQGSRS